MQIFPRDSLTLLVHDLLMFGRVKMSSLGLISGSLLLEFRNRHVLESASCRIQLNDYTKLSQYFNLYIFLPLLAQSQLLLFFLNCRTNP